MSEFFPAFCEYFREEDGTIVELPGWYIFSEVPPRGCWIAAEAPYMNFHRKVDCQRAVESLNRNGITTVRQLEEITDDEFRRMCCEGLQW